MPRFFFHIRDGQNLTEDPDGSELSDLDAARVEALHGARQLVAETVRAGELIGRQSFEIRDEAGELQAVVALRDALRLA